jgi:hypothetical protein
MSEQHPPKQTPEQIASMMDPADFRTVVANLPEFETEPHEPYENSSEDNAVDSAVDAVDKGLGKSGNAEPKPEEDVETARQRVAEAQADEAGEEPIGPTATQRADASAKMRQVAQGAASRVKRDQRRAETRTKAHDAPGSTGIIGEAGVTDEKATTKTKLAEGTDGQQYVTEPTTEAPQRARVPKDAATKAKPVPEAVIPSAEPEQEAPVKEATVLEGVVTAGSSAEDEDRFRDDIMKAAVRAGMTKEQFLGPEPTTEAPVDADKAPEAEEAATTRTSEEQIDDEVLAAMGGYDEDRPAKRRGKKARREAERAAEPVAEEATEAPAPEAAAPRSSRPSPADMPKRRPQSRDAQEPTVAEATTPQVETPAEAPDQGGEKSHDNGRSDEEVLADLDYETPDDLVEELMKTAGERDTRSPEEVEADDAAAAEGLATALRRADASEENSRPDAVQAQQRRAMTGNFRARYGSRSTPEAKVGSAALSSEEDLSWLGATTDGAAPDGDATTELPEVSEPDSEPSRRSIWDVWGGDDDPYGGASVPETNATDESSTRGSLTDELLGYDDDEPLPPAVQPGIRSYIRAKVRLGWDRARSYFSRDENEDGSSDRQPNPARRRRVIGTAIAATAMAGALFGGLAGDTSGEGPTHAGRGPSAAAEKHPGGAAVDSGKKEGKPSRTAEDVRGNQRGAGAPDLSHTFDVGRETVKVSANNEVVVTLKQGGTVWDALDKIGDELHINHSDEDIAETVQSMHLKPGQDRQMKVGSSYTFKVQGGKLVAKK